jgi:hypothetical protein
MLANIQQNGSKNIATITVNSNASATSPLCLVGCVRWDARSDRVPPLQTIIFSSFTGRTPVIIDKLDKFGVLPNITQSQCKSMREREIV